MINSLIYNSEDTICAIATPHGSGGIAVVRVSGPDTFGIVSKLWRGKNLSAQASHTLHLGYIIDHADDSVLDQAVASVFKGPASFTGEDVIELGIHGSQWIQKRVIEELVASGCRIALPGEFTRRAFVSGRIDLAEAEAVADVIAASSKAAHRLAMSQLRGTFSQMLESMRAGLVDLASLLELELDFSEEDVEFASRKRLHSLAEEIALKLEKLASSYSAGQAIKAGVPVAIIGKTNAGKSSLLNALLGDDRAIVSDVHGTTRDVVEDTVEIGPYLIRFKDTAGLRVTDDPVENMGIERSRLTAGKAEIVLFVVDAAAPLDMDNILVETSEIDSEKMIFVINKTDISARGKEYADRLNAGINGVDIVMLSVKNGEGIDQLKTLVLKKLDNLNGQDAQGEVMVTNTRHAQALAEAAQSLRAVMNGLDNGIAVDFVAQDLRQAIYHLSSITGTITTPELLQNIFSHFCIGK